MVKIIESYLMSKAGNIDGGEDRLILGPNFYGVVDGATDKSGLNWGTKDKPKKGGAVLADIVKEILENPGTSPEYPERIVKKINEKINSAAEKADIDLSDINNRADVGFAAYVPENNSIYKIHDCNFGFLMEDNAFKAYYYEKPVDKLTSSLRKTIIEWYYEMDINPFKENKDPGREFILNLLEKQPELQNKVFDDSKYWHRGIFSNIVSYKTLNGLPTKLDIVPVPEGTREIILTSDGFPVVKDTLAKTKKILNCYLKKDPHCIRELKGTKGLVKGNLSYDDMCYLRIIPDFAGK